MTCFESGRHLAIRDNSNVLVAGSLIHGAYVNASIDSSHLIADVLAPFVARLGLGYNNVLSLRGELAVREGCFDTLASVFLQYLQFLEEAEHFQIHHKSDLLRLVRHFALLGGDRTNLQGPTELVLAHDPNWIHKRLRETARFLAAKQQTVAPEALIRATNRIQSVLLDSCDQSFLERWMSRLSREQQQFVRKQMQEGN